MSNPRSTRGSRKRAKMRAQITEPFPHYTEFAPGEYMDNWRILKMANAAEYISALLADTRIGSCSHGE